MKNQIIGLIKENLIEIMPELEGQEISVEDTLVDIGANSIDRGELITLTLERLNLEVSRIEFAKAQSIKDLADMMAEKMEKR
ncbi:MAG: phosphopantetheine-binding protein [Sporocytophaga sp.]|nr:phosphopantetheine-binding protein [Sporocytophaga sp.]